VLIFNKHRKFTALNTSILKNETSGKNVAVKRKNAEVKTEERIYFTGLPVRRL
jgi:hypothetical protein